MRLFFTIMFFLLCSVVKAQQLNTLEYYFDTDPGYGNGSQVAITGTSADADFSLTMPSLPPGIHLLNIRVKNNAGIWGTTYQKIIFINSGAEGTPALTTAEYFFDTDPGFGKGTPLTLSGASVDADVNFNIGSLPTGSHIIYLRLKNNNGSWSTVYQSTVFINAGSTGTAAITTAEYYFDTDPGVGKATAISLNNNSLDSNLKLNTTGLSNGIHTLVIRLKNNNNAWSTSYTNDVNIFSGIDSIPQITSLEIFNNTDKGINKNINMPLTAKSLLDTTISIFIPDNGGGDSSVVGLRLHNQAGQTGNVALSTISLCDLYKPRGGFRAARFGNSYAFSDSSLFNDTKQLRWLVDNVADTNYNNSRVFNYTFPNGFIGTKTVEQIAGAGCRADTSEFVIQMQGIEYITPYAAVDGRDYVMQVFGGGLDSATELTLTFGSTVVKPYDIASYQGKMLSAIFDFHDISPTSTLGDGDIYDLHVHFSNGQDTVLRQAVVLNDLGACELASIVAGNRKPSCDAFKEDDYSYITTDLSGPADIRLGSWNYYTMHVTNGGKSLVKETPAWLIIPANYDVQFDINWDIADTIKDVLDSFPADDYMVIDTTIGGIHMQYKMYGLIPPFIEPGQTWDINFKVRSSQATEEKIIYWVQKPMFGSEMRSGWKDCAWDIAGYTPAGCITGAYDYFTKKAGFDANYHSDFSHGILQGALKDAKNFGLTLAGVATSCGGIAKSAAKKVSAEVLAKITFWEAKVADKTLGTINNDFLANCRNLDITKIGKTIVNTVFGSDPNSLFGNNDYDNSLHYISNYSPQHYTVNFENKPTASANTQHVFITDTLSKDKFIFSSFTFNGYRIGDSTYSVPPLRSQLFQTTGIKYDPNLQVRFSGSFDTATGILRADYYSLEKNSNKLIADTSLRGFLPPNSDGISGAGSLSFSIYARDMNTMDTFSNKAYIYFDSNEPIATNSWRNTVDTTAPTGKIVKAEVISDSTVKLFVQYADYGSGFQYNSFFVKVQGDSLFRRIANTASDTVVFTGINGMSYQFFTKAVDNVGNIQQKDSIADVTVVLARALPLKLLSFTGKITGKKTQLNWTTTNEMNTAYFEVERSTDGQHFIKTGYVTAANTSGNNSYTSFDDNPKTGDNYYRLKQYDIDGNYTYSPIVKLYYDSNGFISIAPNPAKEYVDIKTSGKISQVIISDVSGKKVKIFSNTTDNRYPLNGISKGLYFLQVMIGNDLHTFKLLVD